MEKIKAFGKEVFLFLTSKIFLKNFAMMLGILVGFALFSNWFLGCYTNHGESVQVDDFIGMHVDDAERQASDKDFEFIVLDSVWTEGQPSGIILKQNPKPLSRVKEGRKIYVTVTGAPNAYRLPDIKLSAYDFDRYSKRIAMNGVKSRVKERVYDRKQSENSILYFYHNGKKVTEAEVKAGYYVMPGDVLEFVVTEQTSNELQVPDLVCMNFSAAEFLVSSSNLIIGTVNEDGAITNQSTAYISRQEPAAGEPVQMGMQINVWISQGLPDGCTETDTSAPTNTDDTKVEEENW
ncbi:MAG: PASTA domain-containing protein [Saprospiraceae bacterium]|nr:PASTA domain-containing protein [Saprospiraceae bacterium]